VVIPIQRERMDEVDCAVIHLLTRLLQSRLRHAVIPAITASSRVVQLEIFMSGSVKLRNEGVRYEAHAT
jgi:hypothetical protein